ncbi:putative aminotransferase [Periconia macrospinosa]|uniref:Putative aminotransferase n=1 Tax=Periconia macrospinosa TaxID=97972 RepID=A0A2V1D5Y5_9PLEO|nr:putative aminotransferase [Periconia macrospinosa]
MLSTWLASQRQLCAPSMKKSPVFYRNIEEALDVRRADQSFLTIVKNNWKVSGAIDFCSNDLLGLGNSGALRAEFNAELQRYPDMPLGSGASRMFDGNYGYLEMVEQEIADFHGAETGIIINSGFEANTAIYQSILRQGDAVVYDELVHASTHDGIKHSSVMVAKPFRHNDVLDLQNILTDLLEEYPLIRQGKRSVIVAVESIYSMDGDFSPLKEMIQIVKEMFPAGNCQFVVDEAHSTGVIGPYGKGLVCELGVEDDIAIRLHTFGKALGSTGAIILANKTVKAAIVNFSRSTIYTTAPAFTAVAGIRASYNLLKSGSPTQAQEHIQNIVVLFFSLLSEDPIIQQGLEEGILSIPLLNDWESRPLQSHVVAVEVKDRKCLWLFFHLVVNTNVSTMPVTYPTVPMNSDRLRITLHGSNTEHEVVRLAGGLSEWVQEMLELGATSMKAAEAEQMSSAARQVYSW